ncbi:hypothetical protein GCM10010287_31970 [Streptomyces variabilis]|uniref:Uncharacterized protein n=1 Tax=Streptomyces variabilis TaxID=67372 RepID=A0ABQ2TYX6_9ACTN|nr:hypothetical protein GCM10010265_09780 [Streptomyces griseoincarnatus]GGT55502.1 hypothetical protein GCM10010287_31970 [Streptomyces variabilis]
MAVQVGDLERLVVDEDEHALLGRQQRAESGLVPSTHVAFSFWSLASAGLRQHPVSRCPAGRDTDGRTGDPHHLVDASSKLGVR